MVNEKYKKIDTRQKKLSKDDNSLKWFSITTKQ